MTKPKKNAPKNIHVSPKFKKEEVSDNEENETVTIQTSEKDVDELPKIKFKKIRKKGTINFREPIATDRPKNVYIELIAGNYWLWYNTERSQEIGIQRNYTTDDRTQIKSEYGYECDIPATKENIELLKNETFAGTNFMFKDGVRRTLIQDIDKFMEQIKNQ